MGCLAEKTAKNHAKSHTIGFFGAVSSPSGHRSVGNRHHLAADDPKRSSAAVARKMSVYVCSAFLATRIGP
jgi:hypothetical protein